MVFSLSFILDLTGLDRGAGRGSRTPKTRRSADFESAASASSAIPASGRLFHCTGAVVNFEYDHTGSGFFTGTAIKGTSTRKVVPAPERLSTAMEPRC